MKKALSILLLAFVVIFSLTACDGNKPEDNPPEHVHSFGEWETKKPATCIENGAKHRECSLCGEKESEAIPAIGHTEVIDAAVEATCTESGLTEGRHCSVCNAVIVTQTVVDAKGHSEVIDPAVEASCTQTGLTEGKHCADCGKVLVSQGTVPITPHIYEDKYDEDCNYCGFVRDAECAHANVEILVGKDATCTETGLTEGKRCKKCEEILVVQTIIEKKPHSEVIDPAVEATCTQSGLSEGKHCSVCNTVLVEQETTTSAKGHRFSNGEAIDTSKIYYSSNSDIEFFAGIQPVCGTVMECYTVCAYCQEVIVLSNVEVVHNLDNNGICQWCGELTIPGVYDANDNLIASWDTLVNTYGMDVSKDYTNNNYNTSPSSPYYVLKKTEFSSGVKIVIPDSVTIIGDYAFYRCTRLTSITIGNSVTGISDYAFGNCDSLTSITIPDSVTSIGNRAFVSCDSLTSIEVDKNNQYYKSIDGNLYSKDGKKLIQYAIGKTATSFVIPSSVTSIGDDAFYGCTSLTSITIPDSVTSIGSLAFYRCTRLTSITIPDSVTGIGDEAFSFCDSLTSITIPDSVTGIGYWAFYHCDSLTSITIPDSVTGIGDEAFCYCKSLTDVYYTGSEEQWANISIGIYNSRLKDANIHFNYIPE